MDLKGQTLNVRRSRARRTGEGLVDSKVKSHRSNRAIPLNETLTSLLTTEKGTQAKNRLQVGEAYRDDESNHDLIVRRSDGSSVDPEWVSKKFSKAAKKAGYTGVRFHDLRHLHSSTLAAHGAPMKEISDRLGHSQVSFTANTYVHSTREGSKKTAQLFDQALEQAKKRK